MVILQTIILKYDSCLSALNSENRMKERTPAGTVRNGRLTLKEPVLLECQRCHNRWLYTGHNPYFATCTWCKSTVLIRKHRLVAAVGKGQSLARPGQSTTVETKFMLDPKGAETPDG